MEVGYLPILVIKVQCKSSPGGRLLASGSADTTVQVWNAGNGNLAYTYRGDTAKVNTVAWPVGYRVSGPNISGATIASGSDDGTVLVWDVIGQ
ncbi:WD40 repeat domain-containing protein [Ktedonobacter robiniae]|uniref:WD40 repeat domain-containing protein n=1 Tax=Ktedonobacter robiniae TaxID=2778365 RepID=UPI003B75B51C